MLGFFSLIGVAFCGLVLITLNNRCYHIINLLDGFKAFCGLSMMLVIITLSEHLKLENFAFLLDVRFYLIAFSYTFLKVLFRTTAKANEQNQTFMQYILTFAPIVSAPLLVYYFGDLAGFSTTLNINYQHDYEVYLFTLCILLLTGLYGMDKINAEHIYRKELVALSIVAKCIMPLLVIKVVQLYHAQAFFMCMMAVNVIAFGFRAVQKREWQHYESHLWWQFVVPPLVFIVFTQLTIAAVNHLPAQYYLLTYCGASILVAAAFDRVLFKKNNLSRKDFTVALAILGLTFWMVIYR